MTRQHRLHWGVLLVIIASCILLPAGAVVTAGHSDDGVARILSSATGVTLEVVVPWEQLRVDPSGTDYVQVSIPGWLTTSQAGAPKLPQVAEAIGVPFGALVSVQVTPGVAHTIALPAAVQPVATQKMEWDALATRAGALDWPVPTLVIEEDAAVYASESAYPGVLAKVTNDGVLRRQRVVGVAAYPVQYNPATRELIVYESLRIQVTFEGAPSALSDASSAESSGPDVAAYEAVLQQGLLNYEMAGGWRESKPARAAELESVDLDWVPPVPGWRVKVRADGFYKLTYAQLLAAGVPVTTTLDPHTFQLYSMGSEVAIYVSGEDDGQFNSEDCILFYGQAIASKYTRDNVYWLTYGLTEGLRMDWRDGNPAGGATPAYYSAKRHMEGNTLYVGAAPGSDSVERWLWGQLYPPIISSWTYPFTLAGPYAQPATLTVYMLGMADPVPGSDHHATVFVNNTELGDATWDGIAWQPIELPVPQGVLKTGPNELKVVCTAPAGAAADILYVDWAELEFANTFLAEGNELAFGYETSGMWQFEVDGFTSNQLAVYDVTNPALPVRIEGIVAGGSAPTYTVQFQDALETPNKYWVMAASAYRTPQAIEKDTASSLRLETNGADHIIISHSTFLAQAEVLRAWRDLQERAVLVDVQDVYDEFNYGIVDVAAIHDFLEYAYWNWVDPSPSFVVLVGDGHYDPKNYAYTRVSYIHPYLAAADPWIGETAADNRYVTVDGSDTLPDMMLGRLAVNTTAEAAAFIDKIIHYEQTPEPGDWTQHVLAVADNADSGGAFDTLSDNLLATSLPAQYTATRVYYKVTHMTTLEAKRAITESINAGQLIVNYIGHASTTQWAQETGGLFRQADVAGLANGYKLPVMLPMTCMDGYYLKPDTAASTSATAEVVTRVAGKGAVASWSPTGMGVAHGHDHLDRGFFDAVFQDADGMLPLGAATAAGKLDLWQTGQNLDLLDTYLLFGDPGSVITLPEPTAVIVSGLEAKGSQAAITLRWETASEVDILGFNVYVAERIDGPRVKANEDLVPTLTYPGSPSGAVYRFTDMTVKPRRTILYYYWLETVHLNGDTTLHGPVKAGFAK